MRSEEKIRKRRFEETKRFEAAGNRLVLAGLVRRTTAASVAGSMKRKNSPTCGSGRGSLIGTLLAAAKPPGNTVNIARRVMSFTTNWKMRIKNPPLHQSPRSLCAGCVSCAGCAFAKYLYGFTGVPPTRTS